MEKWKMYMEIYQLKQQGFKIRRIAKKLGLSRTTVYKYLEKSPEEMSEWMASTQRRRRKLDQYEMLIHTWLSEHPDLSGAQVYDWLSERFPKLEVGESTARSFVQELREKYAIPKAASPRVYEAIPDRPMGQQAQVDFGETKQKTTEGRWKKMYFISFVLSRSRYKYAEWLDKPFTTQDVIRTHENAFEYFDGIPYELVYDQDSLIVVSENGGDLILTEAFQKYHNEREFQLFVCRKADPESKGKVENTVKFIKQNFAKNRVFSQIDKWNELCWSWLDRTGNGKVHNTIKKRPVEVFSVEKKHLKPITKKIVLSNINSSITRIVRKDNTILHESNRYSVPLGTYQKDKNVFINTTEDGRLQIREEKDGPLLAEHKLCENKGELIQDTQHRRDRTKGIASYITTISQEFRNTDKALLYLQEVHQRYPRYIRDQLEIISHAAKSVSSDIRQEALDECVKRSLYSATEFRDVVSFLEKQLTSIKTEVEIPKEINGKEADYESMTPEKRDLAPYLEVLEGAVK
ncbi:IS21 family transposase [Salinibacillus aidingensis]|uniref:IS21 family transposase n=1 Tax=Salinibacillus aidingensis TaxID=237684 RepID=A0ABP3LCH7_9BACI